MSDQTSKYAEMTLDEYKKWLDSGGLLDEVDRTERREYDFGVMQWDDDVAKMLLSLKPATRPFDTT